MRGKLLSYNVVPFNKLRMIEIETIDRICKAFKITPAELLLVPTDSNKEIIENIVTLLSDCPTKKLKKIYEMVQLMVKG